MVGHQSAGDFIEIKAAKAKSVLRRIIKIQPNLKDWLTPFAHESGPETPIAEDQDEPTVAAAIQVAPRFGLKTDEAKPMLREVFAVVGHWREVGIKLRLKATTLDAYESAFENPLMQEARKLLGRS